MTDPSGPPSTPNARTLNLNFDLSRLPSVATALGVALVSAAILVSAVSSRRGDGLDVSNFAIGLLAVTVLLVIAARAHLLLPDAEHRATLVSWPGAAGIVGAAIMLGIAIDDDPATTYVAGAVILVLSALSYATTKAAPFVLTTILGLALVYMQVFSDVVDVNGDGPSTFMISGAAIVVFVGGVTAVGWLLPKTRVLSAVVVGVGAIAAFLSVFAATVAFSMFSAFAGAEFSSGAGPTYSGSFVGDEGSGPDDGCCHEYAYISEGPALDEPFLGPGQDNPYRNDIWVMLSYGAALALFWALCALATGHVAFRILSVAILVVTVPASVFALSAGHATGWQIALTALGGLVLAAVGFGAMASDRGGSTPGPSSAA